MAGNATKKKVSIWKVLIWILLLVFFYNFDEIFDTAPDGDSDPYGNGPGIVVDGSNPGTTDQNTVTQDEKEKLFAAVPEHLRSNFFLTYKELGCCKTLTGAVHVTVVMISDSVSTWDDASVQKLKDSLNASALDIVTEAKGHGEEVSLSFGYYNATLNGDICSGDYSNDWQEPALESAGLPSLSQLHDHITGTYQVKEAPLVFAFNKESRAYASVSGNEFLVLFSNDDFGGFQHELSHVFGAKDFYYPAEVKELANTYLTDSVMNSGEIADPLTAYLIGWTDTLSDSALQFLENSNSITAEYMDEQGKINSFTGNGTKVFDNGTYTGDMIRGMCHGTGTMTYDNGGWYTGSWSNGNWSGNGTGKWIYEDGGVYEGTFFNGQLHGTGTFTYSDGGWYSGGWDNGNWSGSGTGKWFYQDGGVYEGAFYNGQLHGTGTYTYSNGSWYSGGWDNGSWSGNGKGKWFYQDGSVYEGSFLNGQLHGTGTYTYSNGGWYTGGWNKGNRSGTGTGKEIYDNGVYEGAFKDGSRHGQGTYTWSNGDSYTGQWANGQRTGYGTYTWADGSKQSGTWENGKFIG